MKLSLIPDWKKAYKFASIILALFISGGSALYGVFTLWSGDISHKYYPFIVAVLVAGVPIARILKKEVDAEIIASGDKPAEE